MFDFDSPADEYAVMGNPITHSKSPMIHSLFAKQTSQRIHYSAIQVDPGGFEQAVGNFFANGGKGLNVTVPFKQEAWALSSVRSERAELAGAVNTLLLDDSNAIHGDNTDGVGLVNDIVSNCNFAIGGCRVLLIGAGGAARGVIAPLLGQSPAQLAIANRSIGKAVELAQHFAHLGTIEAFSFDALHTLPQIDLVINATSASLSDQALPIPPSLIEHAALSYDMMYGAKPTAFMQKCSEQGAKSVKDGLGMLVEQAAESFFIWRGVRPDTQPVIDAVRQMLNTNSN